MPGVMEHSLIDRYGWRHAIALLVGVLIAAILRSIDFQGFEAPSVDQVNSMFWVYVNGTVSLLVAAVIAGYIARDLFLPIAVLAYAMFAAVITVAAYQMAQSGYPKFSAIDIVTQAATSHFLSVLAIVVGVLSGQWLFRYYRAQLTVLP